MTNSYVSLPNLSNEHLDVWPDDVRNSAYRGSFPDLASFCSFATQPIERMASRRMLRSFPAKLECDIEADFVPVFEVVCNCLRGGKDADRHTLHVVSFNAESECEF